PPAISGELRAIPSRNSAPVRAFSWKNTCPMPRNTSRRGNGRATPARGGGAGWATSLFLLADELRGVAGDGAGSSADHLNLARAQVVDGADDFQLLLLGQRHQDRLQLLQPLDALLDVGPGDVFQLVAGLALAGDHGGADRLDELADG